MERFKSYFAQRTEAEIKKLDLAELNCDDSLVERILALDLDKEAIMLKDDLVKSKKAYKHGPFVELTPGPENPIEIIKRELTSKLTNISIGYSFRPKLSDDKRLRIVPFVALPMGLKLFAYTINSTYQDIKPYPDAQMVAKEGTQVVCKVPSTKKNKLRYAFKLMHVPLKHTESNVIWSINRDYFNAPKHTMYSELRYILPNNKDWSDAVFLDAQTIAAYFGVSKHFHDKNDLTPHELSPFPYFSRKGMDFYDKLCNNLLNKNAKKLNMGNKCNLLARMIKVCSVDDAFWKPQDGRIQDYC